MGGEFKRPFLQQYKPLKPRQDRTAGCTEEQTLDYSGTCTKLRSKMASL